MGRLVGFLLLLFLAAKGKAGTLQVWQAPPKIQASLKGSVELFCQIDVAQHWERLRVEWLQNSNRTVCQVLLGNANFSNCCRAMEDCDRHLHFIWHPPNFTLRIDDVRESDMGWYHCVATVEIPVYLKANGTGTLLNASAAGGGGLRNSSKDRLFWLGVAGALAVTVLLLAVVMICCYKYKGRNPGQSEIYVNVLYRKKQAAKKGDAQANDERKHNSIYTLEFEKGAHSWKPPVPERSPIPTKAPHKTCYFKQRSTERP